MKGKLRPGLRFKFDFEEEIPSLNMEVSEVKKEKEKTKIVIHKKPKNGRRDSSTGLF
jgi:hypothetical protein